MQELIKTMLAKLIAHGKSLSAIPRAHYDPMIARIQSEFKNNLISRVAEMAYILTRELERNTADEAAVAQYCHDAADILAGAIAVKLKVADQLNHLTPTMREDILSCITDLERFAADCLGSKYAAETPRIGLSNIDSYTDYLTGLITSISSGLTAGSISCFRSGIDVEYLTEVNKMQAALDESYQFQPVSSKLIYSSKVSSGPKAKPVPSTTHASQSGLFRNPVKPLSLSAETDSLLSNEIARLVGNDNDVSRESVIDCIKKYGKKPDSLNFRAIQEVAVRALIQVAITFKPSQKDGYLLAQEKALGAEKIDTKLKNLVERITVLDEMGVRAATKQVLK